MSSKFWYYIRQTFKTSLMGQHHWIASMIIFAMIDLRYFLLIFLAYIMAFYMGYKREVHEDKSREQERQNIKTWVEKTKQS